MKWCQSRVIFSSGHTHTHSVWKSTNVVAFNIASEASYIYFLSRQNIVNFGEFGKSWSWRSNSVTRQVTFNRTKINGKFQMRHFEKFSNIVHPANSKRRRSRKGRFLSLILFVVEEQPWRQETKSVVGRRGKISKPSKCPSPSHLSPSS